MNILQRDMWRGEPMKQANCIWLRKTVAGRELDAIGELWLIQLGWDIRLFVDGQFVRSQVCRTQDEVFDTIDEWQAALRQKGWAVNPPDAPH